jgi:hypothetical protein
VIVKVVAEEVGVVVDVVLAVVGGKRERNRQKRPRNQ